MEKKPILFDLDGTLSESKIAIDPETTSLVKELLKKKKGGVLTGGAYPQLHKQSVSVLALPAGFPNLYLCATCATSM